VNGIRERGTVAINGFLLIAILLVAAGYAAIFIDVIRQYLESIQSPIPLDLSVIAIATGIFTLFFILPSFVINNPNESIVILFFGRYIGTLKRAGFFWVLPFTSHQKVSRKVVRAAIQRPARLAAFGPLKRAAACGNPIEIGAVIVWHVEDSARAALNGHSVVQSEHFDPVFVARGAAAGEKARTLHASYEFGSLSMNAYAFGA
jgi:hypothetical protein